MIAPKVINWYGPMTWPNECFLDEIDGGMRKIWRSERIDKRSPSVILSLIQCNETTARRAQLKHLPIPLAGIVAQYRGHETLSTDADNRTYTTTMELLREADNKRDRTFERSLYGPMGLQLWLRNCTPAENWEQLKQDYKEWSRNRWDLEVHVLYPRFSKLVNMLATIHIDEENPRVVSWYEVDLRNDDLREAKVKSMRWTKFLQMLRKKYGFRFTDAEIETASTWIGDNLKAPEYHFREVTGEDIRRAYDERYFNSCMHKNDGTNFYDDQPNVSLLRIEDEKGKLVGRALIWDGEALARGEGWTKRKLLDRIYPSDGGPHVQAAIRYAKERGWLYKKTQSIDGQMSEGVDYRAKVHVADYYPYMDTLAWPDDEAPMHSFYLTNFASCPEELELRYTDGRDVFSEDTDRSTCELCGGRHYTDEMRWVETAGGMVCEGCLDQEYTYSEIEDEYVPNEDSVELANLTTNWGGVVTCNVHNYDVVYSEADNAYYWNDTAPRYLQMTQELIEVTAGDYDGEYTILDNVIIDNTDDGEEMIWHVNDTASRDAYILEQRREVASYMSKED